MFELFGVSDRIEYGSIENLCERILNAKGDIRELSLQVLQNGRPSGMKPNQLVGRDVVRVLLVDEVDVFFKNEFFGRLFNPGGAQLNSSARALLWFVWENRKSINYDILLTSKAFNDCLANIRPEMTPLLQAEAKEMVRDVKKVEKGTSTKPYTVSNGRIGYKVMDSLDFDILYGYETAFAYIKEYQAGNTTMDILERSIGLEFSCGHISYAELPVSFDVIMGVTGTLKGLSELEFQTLNEIYRIDSFSYIPSAYGRNRLDFRGDNPKDVKLSQSKADHFLDIRHEIDSRRKDSGVLKVRRPVMVFFDTPRSLLDFYCSEPMQSLKREVQIVTENSSVEDRQRAFEKATEQGAVTLLNRDYGRGTDFRCFDDKVLNAGGVHVIQAFYSADIAEEYQIKGRAARQGEKGSYSMVLSLQQLGQDLGVTFEEFNTMRNTGCYCTFLDEKRTAAKSQELGVTMDNLKEAEDTHYRTLAFIDALVGGDRIEEVRDFLLEMGGNGKTGAFGKDSVKASFIKERKLRIHRRQQVEKERRQKDRRDDGSGDGDPPIPLLGNGRTKPKKRSGNHYELLGVPRDASRAQIIRAFRTLAMVWHPDKNQGEDKKSATEYFQLLTTAREILLHPGKRASYDSELKAKEAASGLD